METLQQTTAADASERFIAQTRHLDESMWQVEQERAELDRVRVALDARSGQLEVAARRQAEFLASMADDLRTPLNSLLILAKLLADNDDHNLTAQQIDFAQTIYAAGTDLLSLVDDVLDLVRTESERTSLDLAEQAFVDLRIYLLRTFRQIARHKHTVFEVALSPDLPLGIRTDGKRLRQALKSMLSLAFKFAHGGRVTLSIAPAGPNVVFEVLHRAEGSVGCEHATRLGLSICRELAHALGGEVRVARLHGEGVHLTLELPLVFRSAAALAPFAPAPDGLDAAPDDASLAEVEVEDASYLGRRSRGADDALMLIAEGNAQVASVMLDLVRANGYQGVVASDLGTMRVLLREIAPEGILVGGSLLDIDGWSTLELLKHDPQTRQVPISMSYFDARRYLCLQIGARIGWSSGTAEIMLAALDGAAGHQVGKLLMAGVPEGRCDLSRGNDGRDIRQAASGAAALDALQQEKFDALIVGPALGDMSAIELVRVLGSGEFGMDDLPLALIDGHDGAHAAGTLEIAMLRRRGRLEDILDETALYLAQSVGHRPVPARDLTSRRRETSPELAGRTALILDDDIYNVYAMTGALEQQGMTVVLAETGREGIDALRDNPDIDVVLIDITMPEIDGDSIIHALRATHERVLPIIAVTPHALPGDREKCIGAGASDYISKPVNIEQMLALLRTWLARAGRDG